MDNQFEDAQIESYDSVKITFSCNGRETSNVIIDRRSAWQLHFRLQELLNMNATKINGGV